MTILTVGGVALPAPETITVADEIIWSSNTGRVSSGLMNGDIIAQKKTLKIKWGILTEAQMTLIKNKLVAGFFPITFHDEGKDMTITSYRGTLSKEMLGDLGDGKGCWYKSASVDLIQR